MRRAAAPHGDARQGLQQRPANSRAALLGRNEEIFEIERGHGRKRRVGEEIEGEAYGTRFAFLVWRPGFRNSAAGRNHGAGGAWG